MHVSIDCWVFIEFGEWRREEKGAIMASGIEGEELNDSTTTVIILMIDYGDDDEKNSQRGDCIVATGLATYCSPF